MLVGSERMNKDQEKNHQFDRKAQEQKHPFQAVYDGNAVKNNQEREKVHVFHRPEIKRKSQHSRFMPFILTIVVACVISIFLGMTILKLFVFMDDGPVAEDNHSEETTAAVTGGNTETNVYDIPEVSGYVLQAGVFMEKDNAEEWLNYYETNQLPNIIWEQDNQYYLFTGIYPTEEAAKLRAEELKAEGYEIFAKPWSTSGGEINVSADEAKWLDQFVEALQASLQKKEAQILAETAKDAPDSEQLAELLKKIQEGEGSNADQFYLDTFYLYEQLGKDI